MAREKPRIKLCIPYDYRTRALVEGEVVVDGCDLDIVHNIVSPGERHYRFAQGEFDVGEFSTATFLRTKEKGRKFLALPIFHDRGPRQRNIFYCEGKLNHPSELKGKKVGCFRYGATAVVWARGFLLDEYGLRTTDMGWYVSGREVYIGQDLPVKVERLDPPPPFGQEKPHLARLLSEGVLHAALVAGDIGYLGIFGGGSLPKIMGEFPGVRPLFTDTDEIVRYVKKTRIYPIIHTIALKEEIAERYPDLPAKLIEAFREAKKLGVKYMTPAQIEGYEKERAVLEEDPYAYVLGETEKRTIRALIRYQLEQGLMREDLPLESLFVREAFA
jgi:4,5-dihydroxyphthalate decarboxylase